MYTKYMDQTWKIVSKTDEWVTLRRKQFGIVILMHVHKSLIGEVKRKKASI